MNECIFCGVLSKEPTQGLKTSTGNDMCILLIRTSRKKADGTWEKNFVECFSFGNTAKWIQRTLKLGMKVIVVCMYKSFRERVPEPFREQFKMWYWNRPFFIVKHFYCTDTPGRNDYAEEVSDMVFDGEMDKIISNAAYSKSRVRSEYDYHGRAKRYEDNKPANFKGKDEAYYTNMIDELVQNVELKDLGEQKL